MDVLDRNYAKKLASGIKSITVNSTNDGLLFITNSGTRFDVKLPNFHSHSNLTILEKFSYDSINNLLLYDGQPIVSGSSGTTNYVDLTNKPSINGVELTGNKTLSDLGITNYDDTQVKKDIADLQNNKVDKVSGKSLVDDTEITRLASINNYDDTDIKRSINAKASTADLTAHTDDTSIHITSSERTTWNNKAEMTDIPDLTNYATKTYVTDEIVKASTSGTVDLTAYAKTADVNSALSNKVDKFDGKSLVDDAEIARLATINNYDDTNIKKTINTINSNLNTHKSNTDLHTTSEDKTRWNNKADISDIPTKLSQLNNDTEYIKNTVNNLINYYNKSEIYTKEEITNLIGNINHLDSVIVTQLPSENISTTTIYLIKESTGVYSQHMYISGAWADLGSTNISLDNVYTKTEADSKFALKTSIPTVPTKVSELTNDSGYLTEHQDLTEYAKKSDIKTLSKVPTKVSELTNDSGYITFTDVVSIDETTKHWKVNNKDTGVLAEGIVGKDGTNGKDGANGADGVMVQNTGMYGLRVENGYLNLYLNVIDESNADSQAPPFSLENINGKICLIYTVGGTIQYESKETI